jgi:hypothetical protein
MNVEENIKGEWLSWMRNDYIPQVMSCGIFYHAQINRVIAKDDSDYTFTIAYKCHTMRDLHQYQVKFADQFNQKHLERYGNKVLTFSTIMEFLEDF